MEVTHITWVSAPFSSFKTSSISFQFLSVSDLSSPPFFQLWLWHSCLPFINIRTPANTLAHRIGAVVQLFSHVWLFATPWTSARQVSLTFTIPRSLLKLMSIELVMTSNYLILCPPLLLLPSIIPSIKIFSNESTFHIRWPKYWSFSFSISPSNEYSGLIFFRMDWFGH